jgi:hypothetical protein
VTLIQKTIASADGTVKIWNTQPLDYEQAKLA